MKALITLHPGAIAEAELHMADKRKASEIFSLGLRFFKYEKLDLAMVFFSKVIDIDPHNAQAYVNIGNIYYENKDIETAANFWKYALTLDATVEKAYLNLGNYYYRRGDIDSAISYWLILQSISPTENNSLFNLAVSFEEKNERLLSLFYFEKYLAKAITQKGLVHYEKAQQKIFKLKSAANRNFKVGLKYQRKKEYLKALKAFVKTVEVFPLHLKANLNAGSLSYANDRIEEAISFWHRVAVLEPDNKNNVINLAIAYDRTGQNSHAYCLYQRYLKTQEDLKTFENLKIETRIKELEKIMDDKNTLYAYHYSKAEEFFRRKDYLSAFFEYENSLILKPDNAELEEKLSAIRLALYPEANLAQAYIKSGKRALSNLEIVAAVEHFRAAYNLNPNETSLLEIKENMAKCARLLKKAGMI